MASTNKVGRTLPSPTLDTLETGNRGGRYGEQISVALYGSKHAISDEGTYFVATNPTPDTPIALTTSITTFAETAGAVGVSLFMKNTESQSAAAPKRVYLDFIKLMCVGVPTSSTSWQYALVLDNNPARFTSGPAAIVPVNTNGDSATASITTVYFGAITTAVPNNRRTVGRGTLRGVVPTTFDSYIILSGAENGGSSMAAAAASGRQVDVCPPIIIGAQQNLCMTLWGASNAAASTWEVMVGFWER